jgi:nucleoid-associated protein YgaU
MKKFIAILIAIALCLPIVAKVQYLSEEDYKELNKTERQNYWDRLTAEVASQQQKKADAIAKKERLNTEISGLKTELNNVNSEYDKLYNQIMTNLNANQGDVQTANEKIAYFNQNLQNWQSLSDSEIWKMKKNIKKIIAEYDEFKNSKHAKIPDYVDEYSDLDRKILALKNDLERARPKYYEDEYKVKSGDYLSKIAGYEMIYNDPTKWGIIYRANRDQIKDPNVIHANQILKIPRGLPTTWKVFKGEFLWKIASYPEVYGDGSKWPTIYRENKDQIKDPNLIHPGQMLRIPRD